MVFFSFGRKSVHDAQPQISRVEDIKASPGGQGHSSPAQQSPQDRAAAKRAEQRRAEQERRRREAVSLMHLFIYYCEIN